MTDTVWQRSGEWVGTEVEDSFVMINLETGSYLTLNRTASAVWNALETPQTSAALVEQLRDRFDVDAETCAVAVDTLLDEMRTHRIAGAVQPA